MRFNQCASLISVLSVLAVGATGRGRETLPADSGLATSLLPYLAAAPDRAPLEPRARIIRINVYDFELPEWWDSVKVTVPNELLDWLEVGKHVTEHFGRDDGKKETWKGALKTWALWCQHRGHFPVYLGHCYKSGGELEQAIKVYSGLYHLADTQKGKEEWYRCFLAYCAGESSWAIAQYESAAIWYRRSAVYVGSRDEAISYYAQRSSETIVSCERSAANLRKRQK